MPSVSADLSNGSEIAEYYRNKSVFLTGGTGFIGRVLIEKLLRSCYDLKTIYILIRSKRGQMPKQRLNELLHCKVSTLVGNCTSHLSIDNLVCCFLF